MDEEGGRSRSAKARQEQGEEHDLGCTWWLQRSGRHRFGKTSFGKLTWGWKRGLL